MSHDDRPQTRAERTVTLIGVHEKLVERRAELDGEARDRADERVRLLEHVFAFPLPADRRTDEEP